MVLSGSGIERKGNFNNCEIGFLSKVAGDRLH